MQLRYKWTLATYRLANFIFNTKLVWRVSTKPLWRGHANLARRLYPLVWRVLGRHVSPADAQMLAQAWAWVLPATALLTLVNAMRMSRRPRG